MHFYKYLNIKSVIIYLWCWLSMHLHCGSFGGISQTDRSLLQGIIYHRRGWLRLFLYHFSLKGSSSQSERGDIKQDCLLSCHGRLGKADVRGLVCSRASNGHCITGLNVQMDDCDLMTVRTFFLTNEAPTSSHTLLRTLMPVLPRAYEALVVILVLCLVVTCMMLLSHLWCDIHIQSSYQVYDPDTRGYH